jgi:phage/plasmid-associated DNA primase
MAELMGARMAFKDEVQFGMVWDETRMSEMASGRQLIAEIKFGRAVTFPNTAKLCIIGNNVYAEGSAR